MEVKVNSNFKKALRDIGNVPRKYDPKRIEALHGASLPREFHRQDMESIFKKKIKTRFPILFKRAVEFQMLKARGRV